MSYKKGVNRFTDKTSEELKQTTMGFSKSMKNAVNKNAIFRNLKTSEKINVSDLPA